MQCILLSIALIVCSANALKDFIQGYNAGDRYFYFSGHDGIVRLVDSEEPIDAASIEKYTNDPDNNTYRLYTRGNPITAQILVPDNIESIRNSNYSSSKPTVFLVHGWVGSGENRMNKILTEAFLENDDVNIIVLDWSKLANKGYTTAKAGVAAVGTALGQFINYLIANRLSSYRKMHLVGFSLGAHLVGNAGRKAKGSIARITALDPAGPLWGSDDSRLMPTDAKYVEVIHTNTGFFGYTEPCGHADFYPNGGSSMPGCWFSLCSHSRSYDYMASSVTHNHFMANECFDYTEASRDNCTGSQYLMGNNNLRKRGRGIFRVNTESNYPY